MTEILERTTDLHVRIWAEFAALPGMRLTRDQACRLFGGESSQVVAALQDLVDAAVLRHVGPYYIRADFNRFVS